MFIICKTVVILMMINYSLNHFNFNSHKLNKNIGLIQRIQYVVRGHKKGPEMMERCLKTKNLMRILFLT